MTTTFPKRPDSHTTGDAGIEVFRLACDSSWLVSPMEPDYGLDLRIEMVRDGLVTGEECYVQVKGTRSSKRSNGRFPSIRVRQETINYWLGKLNPVLVVLVDVPHKEFWYDWLEHCYDQYPKQVPDRRIVTLNLGRSSKTKPLNVEVPRYLRGYFARFRIHLSKVLQGINVSHMLYHVTQLWQACADMVIFLQSPTDHLLDEDILSCWQSFYQDFAFHDLVLRVPWHRYARGASASSERVVTALESRFSQYERIRGSFYYPEDSDSVDPSCIPSCLISVIPEEVVTADQDWMLQYVRPRYQELRDNILPTMQVLRDLQGMLFQLVLLGTLSFRGNEDEAFGKQKHYDGSTAGFT